MGKISREMTFRQTDYYDNINIQTKPVVYKNKIISRDRINLETEGLLRLQGDVVKIVMLSENPYAKFYQRVTQVDSQNFIHTSKVVKEAHYTVNNTLNGHIRVVTNEYIITDYDQQYNNFYSDCQLIAYQHYEFFESEVDTMYICYTLKASVVVFTDFQKVKIEIKEGLGSLELVSPIVILVRHSMFICHQTPGSPKMTISKYMFDDEQLHLIKYVSSVFITNDQTSTTFEELSRVMAMYYPDHDTIYILFDLMHSKNFEIQGYRVGQDFVTMEDNYKLIPEDETIPLYYLK